MQRRGAWRARQRRICAGALGGVALIVFCLPQPLAFADTGAGSTSISSASCGPGSTPETGVQGQVPLHDRRDGRSRQGYTCNLQLVGQWQGEGASYVAPSIEHCAYLPTSLGGVLTKQSQGVQVLDVSDPRHPVRTANLTSPAMFSGTHESLKTSARRDLLAGTGDSPAALTGAALSFDLYDLSGECAHPRLMNKLGALNLTQPASVLNHEGEFSPDGNTYWSSGAGGGMLTAIDVRDPAHPRMAYVGITGDAGGHGLSFSPDGRRLYLALAGPAGVRILDVSDIQDHRPFPQVREVGSVRWGSPLTISQHTIPVAYGGHPYLIVPDEFGSEGIHVVDIADERHPRVAKQMQLQIQQPANLDRRRADTTGSGGVGYEAHYCTVDRPADPTTMACGYWQSGIRVFDISDFHHPREIAYYNPPAQTGRNAQLPGSDHAAGLGGQQALPFSDAQNLDLGGLLGQGIVNSLNADWCTSPPRFVGTDQLWVTCEDNGFMVLRFTNGVYPEHR